MIEIIERFIGEDIERDLIGECECEMQKGTCLIDQYVNGRDLVKRFGVSCDHRATPMNPVPEWLDLLRGMIKMNSPSFDREQFECITINRYREGSSIPHHIDDYRYGEAVVILSLGAECTFELKGDETHEKYQLKGGSLVTLTERERTHMTHSVLPLPTGVRYSIVFRSRRDAPTHASTSST